MQFEDEDHAVYMSFRGVTTTRSSLRTTTCDALIIPSEKDQFQQFQGNLLFVKPKYQNKYQLKP